MPRKKAIWMILDHQSIPGLRVQPVPVVSLPTHSTALKGRIENTKLKYVWNGGLEKSAGSRNRPRANTLRNTISSALQLSTHPHQMPYAASAAPRINANVR